MRQITATTAELQKFSFRISLFFLFIYLTPFFYFWGESFILECKVFLSLKRIEIFWHSSVNYIIFFLFVIVGIAIHELIHGVCFSLFCSKGLKSISFGVIKFPLVFYTHCKEPINRIGFWIGTLAPAFLLGLVPAAIGLYKGSFALVAYGFVFSALAAADLLIVYKAKGLTKWSRIIDNSEGIGIFIIDETGR